MNVKNISVVINILCLVSILIPILGSLKTNDNILMLVLGLFFFGFFTFGSAIINLFFATKTNTLISCTLNSAAAIGFAAWFWYMQINMYRYPDPQSGIGYLLVTPFSLVIMIPLWIAWSYFNKPAEAKQKV
jgi:uncharacterized membrane-anchored protein